MGVLGAAHEVAVMFMGEYSHSIDEKGRLIIPSKFRFELGETFVLTRGLDGCLCVYPQAEWNTLESKLRELPLTNKNARKITRFLVSSAAACELDKQGRILVPVALREYAGLDKDVVVTGNIERIEIWDKARWEENSSFDDMDSIEAGLQDCNVML